MNGIANKSLDLDSVLNNIISNNDDIKKSEDNALPSDFAMILTLLHDSDPNNYLERKIVISNNEVMDNNDEAIESNNEIYQEENEAKTKQNFNESSSIETNLNLPFYFNLKANNINDNSDIANIHFIKNPPNLNNLDFKHNKYSKDISLNKAIIDEDHQKVNKPSVNSNVVTLPTISVSYNYVYTDDQTLNNINDLSQEINNETIKGDIQERDIQEKTSISIENIIEVSDIDNKQEINNINNNASLMNQININNKHSHTKDIKKLVNEDFHHDDHHDENDLYQAKINDDNCYSKLTDSLINQENINDINSYNVINFDRDIINFQENTTLDSKESFSNFSDSIEDQGYNLSKNSNHKVSFLSDDKFLVNLNGQNTQNAKFIIDFSENKQRIDITIFENDMLFNSAINNKNMIKVLSSMGYDIGFISKTKKDVREYKVESYSYRSNKNNTSTKLDYFI